MVGRSVPAVNELLISAVVPDLTFHDMSFLKRPRRDPQQLLSRKRELEKRRGEREQEEISAFFLNKNVLDRYDRQGRKQPDASGLYSRDGMPGGNSSHSSGRRHAYDQSRPSPGTYGLPGRIPDQTPPRHGGQSKASTYISWSTSQPSTHFRVPSDSGPPAPSSTPERVRDALARTGIFNNTGLTQAEEDGHTYSQQGVASRNKLAGAGPSPPTQEPEDSTQVISNQPVRIVRYQDRGIMANVSSDSSEAPTKHPHVKEKSTKVPTGLPYVAVAGRSSTVGSARATTWDALKGHADTTIIPHTDLHITHVLDSDINHGQGTLLSERGPERPKAPKWAMIERLESLAENARPSDISPAAPSLTQESLQPIHPAPDNSYLFPLNVNVVHARSVTQAPTPSLAGDPVEWRPVDASTRHSRLLPGLSTSYYSTHPQAIFAQHGTPYRVPQLQNSFNSYADQGLEQVVMGPQAASMTYTAALQDRVHGTQKAMQSYIAEIERGVLDDQEEGEGSRTSPLMQTGTVGGSRLSESDGRDDHDKIHSSSHVGSMNGPMGPANETQPDRVTVAGWEQDEEQKFMSSFWRPNGYPI